MPPEPAPGPTGKRPSEKHRFILAERTQESGGNYLVINAGSGALGAYQVMPANLPGWLSESHQPQMSDYAYLHCPKCQDHLAWVILGGAYDKYGPRGAAAWWYCGQPTPDATYGDPPVYVYVDDVIKLMGGDNFPANTGSLPPGPYARTLPPPHEGDWSRQVTDSANAHRNTADSLAKYSAALARIR